MQQTMNDGGTSISACDSGEEFRNHIIFLTTQKMAATVVVVVAKVLPVCLAEPTERPTAHSTTIDVGSVSLSPFFRLSPELFKLLVGRCGREKSNGGGVHGSLSLSPSLVHSRHCGKKGERIRGEIVKKKWRAAMTKYIAKV
jgi:hypothetical protein